eukprot:jgi/Phyca11/98673/e_gw1.3.654.1
MAFYWECETFQVALAPWQIDPKHQRTVCARVAVAEQWTPGFALRFDLELLGAEKQTECRLMRLVSQRQMLRAFEFAFVGVEAEKRRPPGGEADELLDLQLKKWLAGGGQVPAPPKEELAKWLLTWMIVSPAEIYDSRQSLHDQDLTKRSQRSVTTSSSLAEKSELKMSVVRLNPRSDALDVATYEDNSSEWSTDRRKCQQELEFWRREVQTARQMRDKAEKLAQIRQSQLLKESARKLRTNEAKRRDAQAVRQLKADTLEYREEWSAMESRVKNASIAAHRDQERVKRQVRVALGNSGWYEMPIPTMGKSLRRSFNGPLIKRERDLSLQDTRVVYDLHGRRHSVEKTDVITETSAFDSAIGKVRRLLDSEKSVDVFRRYDPDRSGTLSYNVFQRMLRENGTGDSAELTQEQSVAFFKHFDIHDSGEVDYRELLWGFFNWEAFLKRWHERTNATDRQVLQLFRKYDRTDRGVLPLKEFQLVLDHLGVKLGDFEANLLSAKFDAGKDGYIDYHQLLEYMENSAVEDASSTARSQSAPLADLHSATSSSGMERIWMELQEVATTQAKLQRLLQK